MYDTKIHNSIITYLRHKKKGQRKLFDKRNIFLLLYFKYKQM